MEVRQSQVLRRDPSPYIKVRVRGGGGSRGMGRLALRLSHDSGYNSAFTQAPVPSSIGPVPSGRLVLGAGLGCRKVREGVG